MALDSTNFWFMCISCLIRRLTKRWNSRRTWKICYVFNFQLKKIRSKIIQITLIELWSFISWCPKKQNLVAAFLSWKLKKRKIFQFRHQFGHFIKCWIWHEKHIDVKNSFEIMFWREKQKYPNQNMWERSESSKKRASPSVWWVRDLEMATK